MAIIKNPLLFSKHFGIDASKMRKAGLIDPFLNVDTQLFIDPILLEGSEHPLINKDGLARFRKHFEDFIRLLVISTRERDAAWKAAERQLNLDEPAENGLGYGGSRRAGASRPDEVRDAIIRTAKEIVDLGTKDPEMISLMGFFEEDVGPDTISDFTTRVIIDQLAALTEKFCISNGIPVASVDITPNHKLPQYVNSAGKTASIVLVPSDIVRDLPVANDWSDIEKAAFANAQIRQRVNSLLSSIAKPTVADRKAALREVALGSSADFERFLAAVKENAAFYDPNLDALGYYKLKAIFAEGMDDLKTGKKYELGMGPDHLHSLVIDTLEKFKHHVEKGNLWEELWLGVKPKKERAAQLIYYAIADTFCEANNADISPEANMGGGPIDFKFSTGYRARVLVEMKRSSGTVVHGYEKQLEIYKDASQTQFGIFVIMDFGDLGDKLARVKAIRAARLAKGERASDIMVIDARKKTSASKRK